MRRSMLLLVLAIDRLDFFPWSIWYQLSFYRSIPSTFVNWRSLRGNFQEVVRPHSPKVLPSYYNNIYYQHKMYRFSRISCIERTVPYAIGPPSFNASPLSLHQQNGIPVPGFSWFFTVFKFLGTKKPGNLKTVQGKTYSKLQYSIYQSNNYHSFCRFFSFHPSRFR